MQEQETAKEVLKQTGNLANKAADAAVQYKKDVMKDYEQDPNKRPLGKMLNSEPVQKGGEWLGKLGFKGY